MSELAGEVLDALKAPQDKLFFTYGAIDASYVSGTAKVVFDTTGVLSSVAYRFLTSYVPVANDRVLLLKTRDSYIILGKIGDAGTAPAGSTNWRYYLGVDHIG